MTAPLPKHHDADKVEAWFEESFGMSLVKWCHMGVTASVSRAISEMELVFNRGKVQELLDGFKAETRKSNAGQKAKISESSAMMLLFVALRAHNTMSILAAVEMLMRMDWKQRRRLGITEVLEHRQEVMYDRVWAAVARIRQLVDDEPGNRRTSMTYAEYLAIDRDPVELARRRERRTLLMNSIVRGSLAFLPDEVRDRSDGLVAMDATLVEMPGMQKSPANLKPSDKLPTNFGAGLYVRNGDHDGSGDGLGIRRFGQEAEFITNVRNGPDADRLFPLMFLAVTDHNPGKLRGHGLSLYNLAKGAGAKISVVIADRAYLPNAQPEDLQLPLAQHGVNLVMDYGIDQLGIQAYWASPDGKHSLVMCDGSWYDASMSKTLQLAEKTYAEAMKKAEDMKNETQREAFKKSKLDLVLKQRKQRTKYRLTPRSRHDASGARQYFYPIIEIRDEWIVDKTTGEVTSRPNPGKTVKVPGILGVNKDGSSNQTHLKFGQEHEYQSEKWARLYALRNTVESGNASLKDANRAALGVKMKRLVRGPWFTALCAAMAAACENLRRLADWYQERLDLPHRNNKNRSSPFVYAERNTATYRANRTASTAPPEPSAA